jgi:UDP-GlcNAc:undecaprenyl-phosphate GlcNAc-1-phosphate transferase
MINNLTNNNLFNTIAVSHVILISLALLIIFFKDKISSYLLIIDYPDGILKKHKSPTPRLGGLVLFFYILPAMFLNYTIYPTSNKNLIIALIIFIIYFFVGLLDDQKALSANKKSVILIFALFITIPLSNELIVDQINFKNLNISINLQNGAIFFTIFSIFALYNAFNFTDGKNGVASSLGIFWIIFIIIKSGNYLNFYYQSILISLIIILYFNVKKKIFLGNSGSNLYAIIISLILIQEYKNNNIFCDEIFFILFLPGIDMTRLTLQRTISGNSPFLGDNKHFHHLIGNLLKEKFIFLAYILISIIPILLYNFLIPNFFKVFALSVTMYFVIFFLLNRFKKSN